MPSITPPSVLVRVLTTALVVLAAPAISPAQAAAGCSPSRNDYFARFAKACVSGKLVNSKLAPRPARHGHVPGVPRAKIRTASGEELVLQYGGEIWRASDDGTFINRISPSIDEGPYYANPHTSADGQRVAYDVENHSIAVATPDGGSRIQVYSPDGRATRDYSTGWAGDAWGPSFSPDGTRIVFNVALASSDTSILSVAPNGADPQPLASYDSDTGASPADPAYSPDGLHVAVDLGWSMPGIAVMDADGSQLHTVASSPDLEPYAPRWSPDGTKVVFYAFNADGTDIYSANVSSGQITQLTDDSADEQLPTFTLDGSRILYDHWDSGNWELWEMDEDGSNQHAVLESAAADVEQGAFRATRPTYDPDVALRQYIPRLVYAATENSPALSVRSIAENAHPDWAPPGNANQLCLARNPCLEQASTLATSPSQLLSLGYLGAMYPTGSTASASDYLQEAGAQGDTGRIADGGSLAAGPDGNKIYARVVQQNGTTYLQYWFFYYYDSVPGGGGTGDHEGDWEMAQVALDADGVPIQTTYSRHRNVDSSTCDYSSVEVALNAAGYAVPMVYVASGTHANYYRPGSYSHGDIFVIPDDNATGDGVISDPVVDSEVFGSGTDAEPAWAAWPGLWGGSPSDSANPFFSGSPRGPLWQGTRSTDPAGFATAASGCDATTTSFRSAAGARADAAGHRVTTDGLPRPTRLSVRTRGSKLLVKYTFSSEVHGVMPRWLLATAQSSRRTGVPHTVRVRWHGRTGTMLIPRARSGASDRVRVSAMSNRYRIGPSRAARVG